MDEAAKSIGISTQTLVRWMKLPEFQTAYREARRAAYGQSIARLQQATTSAVSTLLKIMVDTNTPASTRVRAADSVIDHAAKAIEIEDIDARVAELERAEAEPMITINKQMRRRLDALERELIAEPTILMMPDGSTAAIPGGDYLLRLLGIAVHEKSASPQEAACLDLIRCSTDSKEPGGARIADLVRIFLHGPVESANESVQAD